MYCEHWNLSQRPFENGVNEQFYYPAESHQATMLKMRYAVENRRSAVVLTGISGVGKTLVAHRLLDQLDGAFQPKARVVFPAMSAPELVQYVADKMTGEPADGNGNLPDHLGRIERFLQARSERGEHPVVLVEEAHLLEEYGLLEPLRMLLNLAADTSDGEAAWTLILSGQPSLMAQVERYPALDERIAVKCVVSRLTCQETIGYIQHRLQAAGGNAEDIFAVTAMERIHNLTEGLPRRINRLCDLALMVGYAEDRKLITTEVIDSVHGELIMPVAA